MKLREGVEDLLTGEGKEEILKEYVNYMVEAYEKLDRQGKRKIDKMNGKSFSQQIKKTFNGKRKNKSKKI